MTPERWQEVQRLYHAALPLTLSERAAFLREQCTSDDPLRREVESLLAQVSKAGGFLDAPALEITARAVAAESRAPLVGQTLGPYSLLSLLGAGGMGEVYRATDTKLGRDVALKFLPDTFTHDPERLARFRREAQLLAALNHPHIGAIYGLDEADGLQFLVLELVDGESLDRRIARGAIPVEETLSIARQIAEALEAAHEKGIIHRDLKPANIALTNDGNVKVLDFGLAKATEASGASSDLANSPTITSAAPMTGVNVILGTAAYMSPEQAKGRAADKRSDVWAFGCVLYETLTGKRVFDAPDVAETIALVLTKEPDWSALPSTTPVPIRRMLRRCLEKDRVRRLASLADACLEIEEGRSASPHDERAHRLVDFLLLRRSMVPWLAAILAVIAVSVIISRGSRSDDARKSVIRFVIDLPNDVQVPTSGGTNVAISPQGTHIVYAANQRLYLRALDQSLATPIAGTDGGGNAAFARSPVFSPDGRWIAFWHEGRLKKVAVSGGAPITLADLPAWSDVTWSSDDEILVGQGVNGIRKVKSTGGSADIVIAATAGESFFRPLQVPGSDWVMFMLFKSGSAVDGQIAVQSRATGQRRVLLNGVRDFRYAPSGHLIFGRGNALWAQRFDPVPARLIGEAVSILDGVANSGPSLFAMQFAVGATGTMVYVDAASVATQRARLVSVSRTGAPSTLAELDSLVFYPRFSRDGNRLAFAASAAPTMDASSEFWLFDLARGARTRITFAGKKRFYPIWTSDDTRITFADNNGPESKHLLSAPVDGSGTLETVLDRPRSFPTSWSPDGRVLAFYGIGPTNTRDIWMLHTDGVKPSITSFVETPFDEMGAIFSPNGRWVAYVSNKSGQHDIYVRPFPGPGTEVTISVGGGKEPVWAPSGHELFYRHDAKMMVVTVQENASTLTVGTPTRLFDDSYQVDAGASQGGVANYDVSPDGKRFILVDDQRSAASQATPVKLQVVLNWFEELNRRVPIR